MVGGGWWVVVGGWAGRWKIDGWVPEHRSCLTEHLWEQTVKWKVIFSTATRHCTKSNVVKGAPGNMAYPRETIQLPLRSVSGNFPGKGLLN